MEEGVIDVKLKQIPISFHSNRQNAADCCHFHNWREGQCLLPFRQFDNIPSMIRRQCLKLLYHGILPSRMSSCLVICLRFINMTYRRNKPLVLFSQGRETKRMEWKEMRIRRNRRSIIAEII
ncbi:PREDICTED: uncharacterized protein LOC109221260 [Nicotiana attenuata]|uniref:uncharacterized protein LOC109221260 n=1 Tax=Nicotiana attenuata TaxID=49451 RepID=UPI0009049C08|nr:PREDICTED: uncharacterized protein LOC109221260 [Nicotiana attenuata]